jgi:hypothetical protein
MSDDNKKRKGGRPRGSKNKTALVRLDKAAAAIAPQVAALKAEHKLYTLGKDRLAEIDNIMMNLALAYSPADKDEKGNPCRPFWKEPADEARFLRFMALSYDCAKARAPYESPRATTEDQATTEDTDDDPHGRLMRIIDNWIEANEAARAEKAIDVTPKAEPEPAAVETKPDPDDGIDGELA